MTPTSPMGTLLQEPLAITPSTLKRIQTNMHPGSRTPPARFKIFQGTHSRLELVYKSSDKSNIVFLTVQQSVLRAQASLEWHFHQYYLKQRLECGVITTYFGNNSIPADAPPPRLFCHLPINILQELVRHQATSGRASSTWDVFGSKLPSSCIIRRTSCVKE